MNQYCLLGVPKVKILMVLLKTIDKIDPNNPIKTAIFCNNAIVLFMDLVLSLPLTNAISRVAIVRNSKLVMATIIFIALQNLNPSPHQKLLLSGGEQINKQMKEYKFKKKWMKRSRF